MDEYSRLLDTIEQIKVLIYKLPNYKHSVSCPATALVCKCGATDGNKTIAQIKELLR
jgi:hypothetical protein